MVTFDPAAHIHTVKEITLIRGCVRQWAGKYIHRLDDVKSTGQNDGIEMHNLLEAMLVQGPQANASPESKVGTWARALYPHAPAGARPEVSSQFELPWRGADGGARRSSFKIDWTAADFAAFGDWKSTSDPKWALARPNATADEQLNALSGDLQAVLEAYGFMKVFRRSFVDLRWCYVQKDTARTWTVSGRLHLGYCEHWLTQHIKPHTDMIELLRQVNPAPALTAIPHEMIACNGGRRPCFALGHCQFQPAPVTTEQLYQLARPSAP